MSNYSRAANLLRRLGVIPPDLYVTEADPRWLAVSEKLRLVEEELDEAERRGAAEAEEK